MSEQELQLGLARLLPDKVCWHTYPNMGNPINLYQWGTEFDFNCVTIGETEWLHVCRIVEDGMGDDDWKDYLGWLSTIGIDSIRDYTHASWQKKAEAILKLNPTSKTHN